MDFYNQNAKKYFDLSVNADLNSMYALFLAKIPPKAHILDAGCGSGRDSKFFLNHGYQVTAFDGSSEMAKLAEEFLGQKVLNLKFSEISWQQKFDAVWASASLLHLDDQELDIAIDNLKNSLKENGLFFASFKEGQGKDYDQQNRFFNYMDEEKLSALFAKHQLQQIKIVESTDTLGRQQKWFNIFSIKPPKNQLKNKF